jgi:hypothetical protein
VTGIHIAIVAHKDRAKQAEQLAREVDADHVSLDNGSRGAGANHRAAWAWHQAHQTDWAVTLEDDAKPCSNFRGQLEAALTHAPTHIVSLYLGKQSPQGWQPTVQKAISRADAAKACWITDTHNIHAVGLAADRSAINMMLYAMTLYSVYPPDEAISQWTWRNRIDVAYSLPSLVDHLDGEPLIKPVHGEERAKGRVAWRHGTRRKWTSTAVPLIAPNVA